MSIRLSQIMIRILQLPGFFIFITSFQQGQTAAQNHSWFLKVKGWKIHYEIIIEGAKVYLDTNEQTLNKLRQLMEEFDNTNPNIGSDMPLLYPVLLFDNILFKSDGSMKFSQFDYAIGILNSKVIIEDPGTI